MKICGNNSFEVPCGQGLAPLPERPLVSIIVPSFNQGAFIRQTIESCLAQDYRPIEIIVVDGASTDNTVEVLKSFGDIPELKWISEPDAGVVDAVNRGFARARGQLAAIQSSDDFYLPGAVTVAVNALMANPERAFVFGDIIKVDTTGCELMRTSLKAFSMENVLSVRTWIPQPATFFRLALARELKGWREEVPYAADTDLWLRMMFRASAVKLDYVMSARTMHEAQRNRRGEEIIRDYQKMTEQLEPLQTAPRLLRRAARAGVLMTTLHYRTSGEWVQWWLRLKAVFLYPPLVADMGILSLLPGWAPLRHGLSRVKRFVTSTEFSKALSAMTLDLPRMAPKLITAGGWVHVGNRGERLVSGSRGVMLSGGWSSDLHACATLPFLGRWLMRRALAEWRFTFNPEQHPSPMPRVSFVIPHRGRDREPLLRLTLASIMAQRTVSVECIVVEQSPVRELVDVPPGVRYLHLAHPEDPLPWRKAWAFNAGVEAASSDIVVCHDADILAPDRYAEEIVNRFQRHDLDVAHFQRFLFCLNRCDTASLLKGDPVGAVAPERIRQHWQGGTLAIRKSAYGVIGGFDERFVGWTGEDREFFDRCRALNQECEGYLPFIHLWHEPQSTKQGHERERNLAHFNQVLMMPRHERIERLRRHD